MERQLMSQLVHWQSNPQRKPLLLRGPRQVGKTWLLKRFGAQRFKNVVYVNFDEAQELAALLETSKNIPRIVEHLSLATGAPIQAGTTLLIFDEIQECNAALNTLKYFCEDAPELHVAAAGSLLGVALSRPGSFPVGKVDFLDLHPLTFSEFLLANGDASLLQYLESISTFEPIPAIFFTQLTEKLGRYLVVGGMPEPVSQWTERKDLAATTTAQQAILDAYRLDVAKHAPNSDIPKIGYLWDSVPSQLSRENRKFIYRAARESARAREYEAALHWLVDTRTVTRVNRCTRPELPVSAYDDLSAFKLYMSDTGLLARHALFDYSVLTDPMAPFTQFKGALSENYVLQSLVAQFDGRPRYWTSGGEAEVDFVVQRRNDIHPIEVKAGVNVKAKSLAVYRANYSPRIAVRLSLRNLQFRDGLLDVPLFMADQLDRLIGLAAESPPT